MFLSNLAKNKVNVCFSYSKEVGQGVRVSELQFLVLLSWFAPYCNHLFFCCIIEHRTTLLVITFKNLVLSQMIKPDFNVNTDSDQ